jgi:hypothetical protein
LNWGPSAGTALRADFRGPSNGCDSEGAERKEEKQNLRKKEKKKEKKKVRVGGHKKSGTKLSERRVYSKYDAM